MPNIWRNHEMRTAKLISRLSILLLVIFAVFQGCSGKETGRYQLYQTNGNYLYLLDTTTGDLYLVYNTAVQGPMRLSDAIPLPGSTSDSAAK